MVDRPTTDSIDFARQVRGSIVKMIAEAKAAHIGSSLSTVDILAVLYRSWLRHRPNEPRWEDRDRVILSKGHAAAAIYATLAHAGYFEVSDLFSYCTSGGRLFGHATHTNTPGVEISTGSLGHGLPIGIGFALGARERGSPSRTVVILSDGECDEGSNWEGFLFAPAHKLGHLTVIIDYNKIQSFGRTKDVLDLEPLADKLRAFHWRVVEIDGHDHNAIASALQVPSEPQGQPTAIIAHTVKGKGVSFMEDQLLWHYRSPTKEQVAQALKELGIEG